MTPKLRAKPTSASRVLAEQKWLTLIGLPILIYAMLNGIYAVWGVLFIFWGVRSAMAGQVHLLEDIDKEEDPLLFWIIVALWIGSGLLYVYIDFAPHL